MEQPTMTKAEKIDGFDKYDVEYAADTLIKAEEIKRKPKMLAAARKVIDKRLAATKAAASKKG